MAYSPKSNPRHNSQKPRKQPRPIALQKKDHVHAAQNEFADSQQVRALHAIKLSVSIFTLGSCVVAAGLYSAKVNVDHQIQDSFRQLRHHQQVSERLVVATAALQGFYQSQNTGTLPGLINPQPGFNVHLPTTVSESPSTEASESVRNRPSHTDLPMGY